MFDSFGIDLMDIFKLFDFVNKSSKIAFSEIRKLTVVIIRGLECYENFPNIFS